MKKKKKNVKLLIYFFFAETNQWGEVILEEFLKNLNLNTKHS